MACEAKRGCGYRKVGGIYLVAGGLWRACDRLPFPVEHCPACGLGVKFPRSPAEINPLKLFGNHTYCTESDSDRELCRVCTPHDEVAYLLGVGEQSYKTPAAFMAEALELGVSKRIPAIPKKLKVGETWVYLCHRKAMFDQDDKPQLAIFAAFVPQRIEMPVWESELTDEKREDLAKRGITPVPIKDGDADHA